MIEPERPDLSGTSPAVIAYIDALEAEVARLRQAGAATAEGRPSPLFEPGEAPTTLHVITASWAGFVKRTPRHLYERQRRGGMGIFDLDTAPDDPPRLLAVADRDDSLVLLTSQARAFFMPVSRLPEAPVRGKGRGLAAELQLQPGEHLAAILPAGRGASIALLSQQGFARALPAHVVNQNMTPGTALYRAAEFGPLVAACWTSGAGDLFVATRRGLAIRFPERALPLAGGLGIRLEAGDAAVAVEAVRPPEGRGLFLLGADGRGTIREMSGFAANKSPGGGGKLAMKTDQLVTALAVEPTYDLFVVSRLGKIIRFHAEEVPAKEGVVQGVNCMSLRGDECLAATATPVGTLGEVAEA